MKFPTISFSFTSFLIACHSSFSFFFAANFFSRLFCFAASLRLVVSSSALSGAAVFLATTLVVGLASVGFLAGSFLPFDAAGLDAAALDVDALDTGALEVDGVAGMKCPNGP